MESSRAAPLVPPRASPLDEEKSHPSRSAELCNCVPFDASILGWNTLNSAIELIHGHFRSELLAGAGKFAEWKPPRNFGHDEYKAAINRWLAIKFKRPWDVSLGCSAAAFFPAHWVTDGSSDSQINVCKEMVPLDEEADEAEKPPVLAHAADQDEPAQPTLAKFPIFHLEVNSGKARRSSVAQLLAYSFQSALGVFLHHPTVNAPIYSLYVDPQIALLLRSRIIVTDSNSRQRECQKPPKSIQFLPEPIWLGATPLMLELMGQERSSEQSDSDGDSGGLGGDDSGDGDYVPQPRLQSPIPSSIELPKPMKPAVKGSAASSAAESKQITDPFVEQLLASAKAKMGPLPPVDLVRPSLELLSGLRFDGCPKTGQGGHSLVPNEILLQESLGDWTFLPSPQAATQPACARGAAPLTDSQPYLKLVTEEVFEATPAAVKGTAFQEWTIFGHRFILALMPSFGCSLWPRASRPTTPAAVRALGKVLVAQVLDLAKKGHAHSDIRLPNLIWDGAHADSLAIIDYDRVRPFFAEAPSCLPGPDTPCIIRCAAALTLHQVALCVLRLANYQPPDSVIIAPEIVDTLSPPMKEQVGPILAALTPEGYYAFGDGAALRCLENALRAAEEE
ncbi:hypothetical protein PAPYR_4837 [Paratrimastix pyriformis]|uniref:Protein kinase domain-containing protein n=1 Tax=Paratrimastix pyriformis TaxID=342808 RepID=A0ABQ8UPN3_9EUKA|nr:hypothetical protein PAPYR_4837 [Paratrimastix pyriformis]